MPHEVAPRPPDYDVLLSKIRGLLQSDRYAVADLEERLFVAEYQLRLPSDSAIQRR